MVGVLFSLSFSAPRALLFSKEPVRYATKRRRKRKKIETPTACRLMNCFGPNGRWVSILISWKPKPSVDHSERCQRWFMSLGRRLSFSFFSLSLFPFNKNKEKEKVEREKGKGKEENQKTTSRSSENPRTTKLRTKESVWWFVNWDFVVFWFSRPFFSFPTHLKKCQRPACGS